MTAAQRLQIQTALGRDTLRIAEQIHRALEQNGTAPRHLWRALLAELSKHADLMETAPGQLFTYAVLGRMKIGDSSNEHLSSSGFPLP